MSLASVAATSGVRTMGVAIRGDSTDLSRSLAKSAAEVDAWEKKTAGSASRWSNSWKVAAAGVALGLVAMVAALGAAALSAVQFEKNMQNVNSLLLLTDGQLASVSERVLDIAREVPQSAENLAEGLYNIASSGFEGADGLLVLEASAKAASAGLSQTDTSAKAISAVLNAYGLSAASATDVSDVLFQTVNKGVVSFDELSSVVGNFVGMTAAAGVPIQDANAALATMTLAGIGAAEASTSLNRVVQSLIQPSEALAATLQDLGYESGLQALQAEGLYGIMDRLRTVTQGNAEAYLRLFPEIRAARGAFALATDAGATYARLQGEIGDRTRVAGATQVAFAEQMESTAAKWDILTSSIRANTIQVGQQVLPVFNGLLDVINPLANEVIPTLESAWALMTPYMATARDIGEDLFGVLQAIYDAGAPIVTVAAQIAAALAGLGLDIVLNTLEAVTGTLDDNRVAAVALAAVFLSRFLPSVAQVAAGVQQMGRSIQYNAVWRLAEWRTAQANMTTQMVNASVWSGRYTAGVSRGAVALRSAASAARVAGAAFLSSGAATALLTAGLVSLVYYAQSAGNAMREEMSNITSSVDMLDVGSLDRASDKIQQVRDDLGDVRNVSALEYLSDWESFLGIIGDYRRNTEIEATNEALSSMNEGFTNTVVNLTAVRDASGVAFDELERLAQSQGIDLSDAFGTEDAGAARDRLLQYLQDIEKQTGVSTSVMSGGWGMTVEEIEAFSKAVDDATKKASQAFLSATDVIGSWKPDIGVEAEADAIDRLTEARSTLSELERDSAASAGQLESARKSVADAEGRLAEAQREKAEGTLEAFYQNAIALGEGFSTNLDKAVQMGLDPTVVSRLLQEGPEQAGPIVEQMVNDSTGAVIQMVNEAETQLQAINARVVEQARLTAIAVNSGTDELGKALPDALEVSTRAAGGASVREIAAAMGLSTEAVSEIASQFGITLAGDIGGVLNANKPSTSTVAERLGMTAGNAVVIGNTFGTQFSASMWKAIEAGNVTPNVGKPTSGRGQSIAYAGGGILPGWTPGRDVHRFYSPTAGILDLSGGEGIARPELVAALGASRFQALNRLAATGGIDAVRRAMVPYLGGFAAGTPSIRVQPVTVPVRSTHTSESPVYVDKMYVRDAADGGRKARQSRAIDQIGGRRG